MKGNFIDHKRWQEKQLNTGHPELDNPAERHPCGNCTPEYCDCDAHRTRVAAGVYGESVAEGLERAAASAAALSKTLRKPMGPLPTGGIPATPGKRPLPAPRVLTEGERNYLGQCGDPLPVLPEAHQNYIKNFEREEADPTGLAPQAPGAKLDAGKAPIVRGVLQYFPRAIAQVAMLSLYGAEKYSWKGWESVPDGVNRYGDALGRHITKEEVEGLYDQEWQERGKDVLHAVAQAWNALARAELILRDLEK